jgi:hypothetical protein
MSRLVVILLLFSANNALCWGGRGHDAICQAATHLIQTPGLRTFLQSRPHVMGHLCNIPDMYWRSLTGDELQHGNPTHYVNPEILGIAAKDVPTDMKALISKYTGQENLSRSGSKISSVPLDMGSSWWRADQFYRNAVVAAQQIKGAKTPSDSKEEQDFDLPYNKSVFEFMLALGLMGHFVGDNSQPLHVTSDYDGYAANQGGIHSYYEETVVAEFGGDLQGKIISHAKKLKKTSFLTGANPVAKMRTLGEISASEIKDILKLDPITRPSTLRIEKGMSLRTPAERRPAAVGLQRFEKLILSQLGRSALLLAHLWDDAYRKAGSPDLSFYRSYQYPLKPDFVFPDYYDFQKSNKK